MTDQIREAAEYVRDHPGYEAYQTGIPGETEHHSDPKFVEYAKVLANHLLPGGLPRQECVVKYLPGEGPETV